MLIANPMYDAVFKHLLEDEGAARLIVGTILGEEIERLELVPQESAVRVGPLPDAPADFTVQRIDFAATVRTAGGERLRVLIEVQKSHFSDDVARFRRYLGQQYADPRNYVAVEERGSGRRRPLPLVAIYFLGRRLPRTDATVLKVVRRYVDGVTGEALTLREDFVEGLTHDCYVVQVPLLTDRRRNDLERLLSVFDQELRTADRHVLEIDEARFPRRYAPVLRRLQAAAADHAVADSMALEDEIVGEWMRMTQAIDERDAAIAEREETITEHEETIRRQQAELDALRRRLGEG